MNQKGVFNFSDGEPAANLRHLLYGNDSTAKMDSPLPQIANEQTFANFFTNFDKAFSMNYDDFQISDNALVKKQDEYIEQLENENKMLKKQLEALHSRIQEVVNENEKLIQEHKNLVLNPVISDSSITMISKGLSDEEKMFQGKTADAVSSSYIRNEELVHKIKQLENEILRLREDQKSISKEDLMTVQREKSNLSLRIGQLEDVIVRLKEREEDAQNKIRQGIVLVEQAQMEKFQVSVEKDVLRENLDKQQARFEDVFKDCERRIELEKERLSKLQENQLSDCERELQKANGTIAILKSNLEKSEREKLDVRHQLQRVSSQLDNFQTEHSMSVGKFQEEVTKALLERNQALENLTQMKLASERMKLEHQKESQWMTVELDHYRKKLDEVDSSHLKVKSELNRLQLQKKVFEKHVNHVKITAERQRTATKGDTDNLKKYSKLREEQLQEFAETTKRKYVTKYAELEGMLEKQIELGKRFRAECHLLDEKLQKLTELHRTSTAGFERKNNEMIEKLMNSNRKCLELENNSDKLKNDNMEMKRKLSDLELEISSKKNQITDMLNNQRLLVKERQILQEELKFVLENINVNGGKNV